MQGLESHKWIDSPDQKLENEVWETGRARKRTLQRGECEDSLHAQTGLRTTHQGIRRAVSKSQSK